MVMVKHKALIPVLAVSSIVLGLVLCVASIPEEFQPPGALFWPALSLSAGLLIVPILRIRLDDSRAVLQAENFVLLAFIYWIMLDLIQISYPLQLVDLADVELAFTAVAVMA